MTDRTLDRIPQFDIRSRGYSIRPLLTTNQPRSYTWGINVTLDQGTEGACVGFAWAHEHAAHPVIRPASAELALSIYHAAQKIDPWPGENYSGTSVLAGAQVMQHNGALREYRWAFNTLDALTAISRHGPAVLGIGWREGMWDTDSNGYIHATGRIVGGHAILARGVNVKNKTVTLRNSWGPGWGRNGDALLSWDDFDALLQDDGECCIPVLR